MCALVFPSPTKPKTQAVALVLFNTYSEFLKSHYEVGDARSILMRVVWFGVKLAAEAIGSPVLGIIFGWSTALLFKRIDFREHQHLELPLFLLLMYVPFVAAECLSISGIVAIFFTGISARRYVLPNVTETTKKTAESIFKTAAYLCETCIFLELGLSVFGLPGSFNWMFIFWTFLASLAGRALGIYPIAFVHNYTLEEITYEPEVDVDSVSNKSELLRVDSWGSTISTSSSTIRRRTPQKLLDKRIPLAMTHVLWFAGMRGAVAYACVRKFPNLHGNADEFTAATMVIVLVSIIIMGGATESLLRALSIAMNVDEELYMREWHRNRVLEGCFHDFGTYRGLKPFGLLDSCCYFGPILTSYACHFKEQNLYKAVTRDDSNDQESDDSIVSPSFSFFEYQAQPADPLPQIIEEKEAQQ